MPTEFRAERGDVQFRATFEKPLFALWRSPDQLFELLLQTLSKHGLRMTDLKWTQPPTVADVQLSFYLFDYKAAVRIRIDRVELEVFNALSADVDQLQEVAAALVSSLKRHASDLTIAAYVVAVNYHGRLEDSTPIEFTRALTADPPGSMGPSTGAGAVFYYGPGEERISSAVTLDLSAVVPDALFFRVQVVWDASRIEVDALATRMRQYTQQAYEAFGLSTAARQ